MSATAPPQDRPFISRLLVDLALMVAIGVVLALIGPFGSFNTPLPLRLVLWVGFALLGYLLYAPIDTMAQRLAPRLELPAWGLRLAGVLLASIPMAALVWIIQTPGGNWTWPGLDIALTHYAYVAVIGGLITLFNTMFQSHRNAEPRAVLSPSSAPEVPARPRLIERLPPALGSDVIALEMEDHYVRVHTALGSEMVLMRLRDAVVELDGIEGMQIHRSWWVARGAVEDVLRDGRNVRLKLARGIEAPVSRAQVSELKSAGWI